MGDERSEGIAGVSYVNKSFDHDDVCGSQSNKQIFSNRNGLKESDKNVRQLGSKDGDYESQRATDRNGLKESHKNVRQLSSKDGDCESQRATDRNGLKESDKNVRQLGSKGNDRESPGARLPSGSVQGRETPAHDDGSTDEVPDGGWGWIVTIGGFTVQTVVNIFLACFGILYSEFLLDLGTSATFSSWIYNILGFMFALNGIFIRGLVEEFGYRSTTVIGILMIFSGSIATLFANSAWFILIAYSLVTGTGIGVMGPVGYAIVPVYFRKRLGIANGIMSSGVSVGQIVGPLLISYLRSEYGFRGAVLLIGGIILQCFIAAAVFHPLEWHLNVPRKEAKKPPGRNVFKIIFRIFSNTLGNLKLMRSPVAFIVALGGTLNVVGYLNFLALVPFAMQEIGYSVNDAATGLTVSGFTNFITRLVVSFMSDASWFNMRYCFMGGTMAVVLLSIAFCFLNDLTAITILMGFWGCGVGAFMGLFNLIMVKYVGVQNILAELGLSSFFSSIWFLACGPIVGAIRDASGNYNASIYMLAGSISITFVMYLFLPVAISYEEKRKSKQQTGQRGTAI